ncbi:hypoxanthine phosphoribosyltransferase [Oenococcus oeni]|uniref:hypoxanthine phosphoribosyltransferase n=2 Tax=Oenococcus oeni TaxID=1247 RepID=UPI00065D35BE|nr:hypoxanthine phosphoribosyltransferase [Oenococcus oeni]KMQ38936.1 hypoxanthine phosphoribosyltransferase [Oenococcus oeni]OIK62870.1 hypoxanthine phosphoribosyltransferase [Oenococcus oeni]OIK89660.1 hypoxanthine phosphoribosyltransferase [Oenococcus oeni]OIL88523.1 hypoxanthine phosphoribosyltransferase [Oenococcus oeni]OIM72607.1 hypoxanthine phosphoribosyltransferase [Oenococcus oeni]
MTDTDPRFSKILHDHREIKTAAKRIGAQIDRDYAGKTPILVVVLKGAVMWAGDLFRNISIDVEMDFIDIASYHGGIASSNEITLRTDLTSDVKDRDVIIVEDIVDTGLSLRYLESLLSRRGARSVKTATMLNKQKGHKVDIRADYVGFEIDNEFVAGYGLDYQEIWRNLPFIGVVNPDIYS